MIHEPHCITWTGWNGSRKSPSSNGTFAGPGNRTGAAHDPIVMMSTHDISVAGALAILFAMHAPALGQDPGVTIKGQSAVLSVSGSRPLVAALGSLSGAFGWRFGFEEARLRYSGDVIDVTSPRYVPKSKDDRAYDARGGLWI